MKKFVYYIKLIFPGGLVTLSRDLHPQVFKLASMKIKFLGHSVQVNNSKREWHVIYCLVFLNWLKFKLPFVLHVLIFYPQTTIGLASLIPTISTTTEIGTL